MTRPIEIREARDTYLLQGAATTYNDAPYPVAHYRETVAPEAFRDATAGRDRVELRTQHNPNTLPLAVSPGGMTLRDVDGALRVQARLPKSDPEAASVYSKAQHMDLGLSVGMIVRRDVWSPDGGLRTVHKATLKEISLVSLPANPKALMTSIRGARGEQLEVRFAGPLVVRRDGTDDDENVIECPECDGTGQIDGAVCALCGGSDEVDQDDLDSQTTHVGRSAGPRSTPTIADLELRAARAKSQAAEARFIRDYGNQLAGIESRHLTRASALAGEALRRGDVRSAALWVRQEAAELDALARGR